jgi:hypothetical protein
MAWAQEASGTTTVGPAETTLATETANATYVFQLNVSNVANGDRFVVRLRTKVLAGDPAGGFVEREWYIANAQYEQVQTSVPTPSRYEFQVRMQKLAGVDRAFDWEVWSV